MHDAEVVVNLNKYEQNVLTYMEIIKAKALSTLVSLGPCICLDGCEV